MDNALINTVEGDDYPESLLFFGAFLLELVLLALMPVVTVPLEITQAF
jgi:hypothetical protein